jgi:hypothetical protein
MRWDPIGVANAPRAQDEYDCLISPLMHMLHDGASESVVRIWLMSELEDHFGLTADSSREGHVAADLVGWWQSRTGNAQLS